MFRDVHHHWLNVYKCLCAYVQPAWVHFKAFGPHATWHPSADNGIYSQLLSCSALKRHTHILITCTITTARLTYKGAHKNEKKHWCDPKVCFYSMKSALMSVSKPLSSLSGFGAFSYDGGALWFHGADGNQAKCCSCGHSHCLRGHWSGVYCPCGSGRYPWWNNKCMTDLFTFQLEIVTFLFLKISWTLKPDDSLERRHEWGFCVCCRRSWLP